MNEPEQDEDVEGKKGRRGVLVQGAIRTTTTTTKTILQQFLFPIALGQRVTAMPHHHQRNFHPLLFASRITVVVVVIHQRANPDQYQGGVAIDCLLSSLPRLPPPVYLCGQFSYSYRVWGRLRSTTTISDKVSLM